MALPSKNADLYRRFKFYGFGFLLGCVVVSLVYKGRGCEMPGSQKLRELTSQQFEVSAMDSCRLKCVSLTVPELQAIMKTGKVNYDKSEVRAKPYGKYVISAKNKSGQAMDITVTDRDTVTVYNTISLPIPAGCNCN